MRRRRFLRSPLSVWVFMFPLLLAGCAFPAGAPSSTYGVTALTIERTSIITTLHIKPLTKTTTNARDIAALYTTIQRLKPFPQSWGGSCPIDQGVDYEITFLDGSKTVAQYTLPLGGCARIVNGSGHDLQLTADIFQQFWAQFKAATRLSDATISDYTPATHPPFAPIPTFYASIWPQKPIKR